MTHFMSYLSLENQSTKTTKKDEYMCTYKHKLSHVLQVTLYSIFHCTNSRSSSSLYFTVYRPKKTPEQKPKQNKNLLPLFRGFR